ncbi:aminopeptidase [Halapricum hydrolyticum]|uniref:Aminopeptidase n=1 Tax=Halapricum hydrolyticum TaxID=2979991 RepID=A0AAE3LE84_9EURY|nr:aminopeptidase [Halapricum hydrolyticum]MCU4717075.1 aminopeptidase [Halapricum hydrolyticum]MCU4726002.1 aminopeptidase [Halapricum hydrolyticum]
MDPRVEDHARILVEQAVEIEAGDEVLISAPPEAESLSVALHEQIAERGARPISFGRSAREQRAFMHAIDPDDYDGPSDALMALADEIDAVISVRADTNTNETGDVPPEKNTAYAQLYQPFQEKVMDRRWVLTQHPAPGNAQQAEMSTPAYEDFVYDAVNKDWEAQREFQEHLVEILDDGREVRVVSGETTDLSMSIEGMDAVNDYVGENLPGGEVFTAPVPDSVEGEVLFDKPLLTQGREVEGVRLVFEGGEVVEHSAEKNEDVLTAVLETDEGARRLGELGIGMNRDIDRFTYNMLFDEKMGDTVHLALGRAYEETVGEDGERNDSAIHLDMIVDMSEDSRIEVDGETVQRDGTFVFEDDFEK